MVKVSKSNILKEASEIRRFIEKNKKLPLYATINGSQFSKAQYTYLLAKQISNINLNGINKLSINEANKPIGKSINEKVLKDDYIDMANRVSKYIETNKKVPNYCTTKKSKINVKFELYVYCFAKILDFYNNNKALPNYCLFDSRDLTIKENNNKSKSNPSSTKKTTKKENCSNPYTSTPHYLNEGCNRLGQCTGYYCGPHSIHQSIKKLGITKFSEKQIASWCGTTTSGTSHSGINTAIAKISKLTGIKLKVQWKNFSDMGKNDEERFKNIGKILCQPDKAVFWHIAYINGGSSTDGKHFGHYECVDKINYQTDYVRALNSLGEHKLDGSYTGKLQDRKFNVQSYFARNTPGGQPALCIITRG